MIAQSLPVGVSPAEVYVFLACVLSVLGVWKLGLGIQVDRKKLASPPLPTGQQPQPFLTKRHEDYVLKPELDKAIAGLKQEIGDVESRIDKKLDNTERIIRDRHHKLDNDLNVMKLEATEGRECATEQFQKVEGRLGELKATTEHTNAQAVRTQQSVERLNETLPEKIANAVRRKSG